MLVDLNWIKLWNKRALNCRQQNERRLSHCQQFDDSLWARPSWLRGCLKSFRRHRGASLHLHQRFSIKWLHVSCAYALPTRRDDTLAAREVSAVWWRRKGEKINDSTSLSSTSLPQSWSPLMALTLNSCRKILISFDCLFCRVSRRPTKKRRARGVKLSFLLPLRDRCWSSRCRVLTSIDVWLHELNSRYWHCKVRHFSNKSFRFPLFAGSQNASSFRCWCRASWWTSPCSWWSISAWKCGAITTSCEPARESSQVRRRVIDFVSHTSLLEKRGLSASREEKVFLLLFFSRGKAFLEKLKLKTFQQNAESFSPCLTFFLLSAWIIHLIGEKQRILPKSKLNETNFFRATNSLMTKKKSTITSIPSKDQAVTSVDGHSPMKASDSRPQTTENLVKTQSKHYISGMFILSFSFYFFLYQNASTSLLTYSIEKRESF